MPLSFERVEEKKRSLERQGASALCVCMQPDGTMKLILRASTQGRAGPVPSHPPTLFLVMTSCAQARLGARALGWHRSHFPVCDEAVSAPVALPDGFLGGTEEQPWLRAAGELTGQHHKLPFGQASPAPCHGTHTDLR